MISSLEAGAPAKPDPNAIKITAGHGGRGPAAPVFRLRRRAVQVVFSTIGTNLWQGTWLQASAALSDYTQLYIRGMRYIYIRGTNWGGAPSCSAATPSSASRASTATKGELHRVGPNCNSAQKIVWKSLPEA
jgi:hypothetical protein